MVDIYREHGLTLESADNAVFAGIQEVWDRLVSKRLRVFKGQGKWEDEYGRYRRDEKGRIVKENDHLMDAMRYGVMSGPKVMRCEAPPKNPGRRKIIPRGGVAGRSSLTAGWHEMHPRSKHSAHSSGDSSP